MRENYDRSASQWVRVLKQRSNPHARLICFPHAGGGASFFHPWTKIAPDDMEIIAVRYPGREDRLLDPFAETMEDLVEPIARSCSRFLDEPIAFFGHSMGASVAYEVALRLQAEHGATLTALFVSGRAGPEYEQGKLKRLSGAIDAVLIEEVGQLGGTNEQAFADVELRDLILPAIRADYRLIERYAATHGGTVGAPVVAYYGNQDEELDADSVAAWARVTRSTFGMQDFEGGHFYLLDHAQALLDDLSDRLRAMKR
jgi:pyochelin biosynthetic protein PchC